MTTKYDIEKFNENNFLLWKVKMKTPHTRVFLKKKLYNLQMSEFASMINPINNFNMLFAQFSVVNFNIIENESVELLL